MSAEVSIRVMAAGDLSTAIRLSTQAGWNQVEADWRRFLGMQPDGCFVAETSGNVIGTTVTCVFGEVAWIAMVLVDAAMRGRGIGTALLRHAIEFLDSQGVPIVRLDATALGRPLYEKLGFVPEYEVARYEGLLTPPATNVIDDARSCTKITKPKNAQSLLALDRAVTGAERHKFLDRLLTEPTAGVRVVERSGQIEGYLVTRPGRTAIQLGPCLASRVAAAALLADAAAQHSGQRAFLDVPLYNRAAVKLAEGMALTVQREFVRMRRGAPISEDRTRLFASSGPELG